MSKKIGFIGLGKMGAPMCQALAKAGFYVVGFDLAVQARKMLDGQENIKTTDDLKEVTKCETIIFMLPNGNIVRQILLGDDGIIADIAKNSLIIDMSSSDPVVYKELEPALAKYNIELIDAPVSGNVSGAISGSLTIMAGGNTVSIDRAKPFLDAMGKETFCTGPLGSGQTMKALNNLLSAGGLLLAVEVLLVAKQAGLDPQLVNNILNVSTGRNNSTERKIEPFVLSGAYNSGFGVSLMAKDLRTAASIAERMKVSMPLGEKAVEFASLATDYLQEGADHTEVARWLENVTGVKL
ncbi:MAG: NAD(P)-dependent oxidoreductase [Hyphomicrobiales bacterium]